MLKRTPYSPQPNVGEGVEDERPFDLAQYALFARRQWAIIASACVVALGLGASYLLLTPPRYVVKAQLLLDLRKVQPILQQPIEAELTPDAEVIDSQVEIVKSELVARWVLQKLDLLHDPEFAPQDTGLIASLLGAFSSTPSEEDIERRALTVLKRNLSVQRVGRTYVLEISYQSRDRSKASLIANTFGEAYIEDQLRTKATAQLLSTDWLKERLASVREDVIQADMAVQEFRAQNNLVDMGSGRTLAEQQLGEVSTQLVQVRAETAEAKARLDGILAIDEDAATDPAVTDSLRNPLINKIREQYLDAAKREADFAARYGPNHAAVINLRKEMDQLRAVARDELRRIAEAYRSEFEIAKSRQESLEQSLRATVSATNLGKEASVSLRMLESAAQAHRALYDSFLHRLSNATQQHSFPKTDARIITPAISAEKAGPKPILVLGAAMAAGLVAGIGIAFAREQLEPGVRTAKQVEQFVGIECLGIVPRITAAEVAAGACATAAGSVATLPPRSLPTDLGIERQVVHSPFSQFAEALRAVKVALDLSSQAGEPVVLGITSALPGEGKSTIAANLAQILSRGGARSLLVDADLRRRGLSQRMTPQASTGLLEVLEARCEVDAAIWKDPFTNLDFLPCVVETPIAHTAELLVSREMKQLLEDARERYQYIVLELPPIAPVIDAKAASEFVDTFLLVIEWGATSPVVIQEALGSVDIIVERMLGAVLNKADMAALRRMEPRKGKSYYDYYSRRA